jgi:hypothetical protein
MLCVSGHQSLCFVSKKGETCLNVSGSPMEFADVRAVFVELHMTASQFL